MTESLEPASVGQWLDKRICLNVYVLRIRILCLYVLCDCSLDPEWTKFVGGSSTNPMPPRHDWTKAVVMASIHELPLIYALSPTSCAQQTHGAIIAIVFELPSIHGRANDF